MDNEGIKELAKQAAGMLPNVYEDGARQTVQEAGKIVGRIPRAINAAFAPLDRWILHREYSIDETKKLLDEKLRSVPPEKIVPPEPHVAIPAIQAISYSMDNASLRDMYANLLAKAMNSDSKDNVHPAFVECIKQMSPIDAENLSFFKLSAALAEYAYSLTGSSGYIIIQSNVFLENKGRENLESQSVSISALQRLGLIDVSYVQALSGMDYSKFEKTDEFEKAKCSFSGIFSVFIRKGMGTLTSFGKSFSEICINRSSETT